MDMKRLPLPSLWVPFHGRARLVANFAAACALGEAGFLTTPAGFLGDVHLWRYVNGIQWHK